MGTSLAKKTVDPIRVHRRFSIAALGLLHVAIQSGLEEALIAGRSSAGVDDGQHLGCTAGEDQ